MEMHLAQLAQILAKGLLTDDNPTIGDFLFDEQLATGDTGAAVEEATLEEELEFFQFKPRNLPAPEV